NLNYGSPVSLLLNSAITPITPTYSGSAQLFEVTNALSALPAGLSINSATGQITGTPTSTGNFTVRIRATNTNTNQFTETDVVFNIAPIVVSYPSPNLLVMNYTYANISPTVSGSVTSYSISPSLPTGM